MRAFTLLPAVLLVACGADVRCDPSPSYTYGEDEGDGGTAAGRVDLRLALGERHGCARVSTLDAHAVECWGANDLGQLGTDVAPPQGESFRYDVPAPGLYTIASGGAHSCVGAPPSEVYCWGNGERGQTGRTAGSNPRGMLRIPDLGGFWLTAGLLHTCAPTLEGMIACWGDNTRGQLGERGEGAAAEPKEVPGLPMGMGLNQLSAGALHTCALFGPGLFAEEGEENELWCWGDDTYGQLGDGESSATLGTPVRVPVEDPVELATGPFHTCALDRDETLWCWGAGGDGQLGVGSRENHSSPVPVDGLPEDIVSVVAGGPTELRREDGELTWDEGRGHTCAHGLVPQEDSSPERPRRWASFCWGGNDRGQFGDGTRTGSTTPVDVPFVPERTEGGTFSCAVDDSRTVSCWGDNEHGQLGVTGGDRLEPTDGIVVDAP